MNTIHDLGGMDGFTMPERDQGPVLKEEWERQVWGVAVALWAKAIPGYKGGNTRADIERIPPELYVNMPYYAKWLHAEEVALVRGGLVTEEELENPDGRLSMPNLPDFVPARPADVTAFLASDHSSQVAATTEPRFRIGDEVVVWNEHPIGHTRVPRYTRGHRGVIHEHHGEHVLIDELPEGEDHGPQHLYTVTFTGPELWGRRSNANDRISVELWELHLEPAS